MSLVPFFLQSSRFFFELTRFPFLRPRSPHGPRALHLSSECEEVRCYHVSRDCYSGQPTSRRVRFFELKLTSCSLWRGHFRSTPLPISPARYISPTKPLSLATTPPNGQRSVEERARNQRMLRSCAVSGSSPRSASFPFSSTDVALFISSAISPSRQVSYLDVKHAAMEVML